MSRYRLQGYTAPSPEGLQACIGLEAAAAVHLQSLDGSYISGWVDVTCAYRADPNATRALVGFLEDETGIASRRAVDQLQLSLRVLLGIEE